MSLLVKMSLVLVRARSSWISSRRVSMLVVRVAASPKDPVFCSSVASSVMVFPFGLFIG